MLVCTHVCVPAHVWSPEVNARVFLSPNRLVFSETESPIGSGALQFHQSGWPVSTQDPPISGTPTLELQVPTATFRVDLSDEGLMLARQSFYGLPSTRVLIFTVT